MSLFEIITPAIDSSADAKLSTKEGFLEGLELFRNKKFAEACVKFKSILEQNSSDKVAKLYLNLSADLMLYGAPDDWDSSILNTQLDQRKVEK